MGATHARSRACAAAAGFLLVVAARRAEAYGVRLRWQPTAARAVTGYRVHVWAGVGTALPTVDVGLPARARDGTLSAVVTGLDPRTEYALAVSARIATGGETPPSNVVRIGYAQVAPAIDSDGDGVNDAADACPGTPVGAAVGAGGCTCTQLACDDGDPCNGLETCAAGTCRPGDLIVDCRSAAACATDADCRDDDACTVAERCIQGRCAHAAVRCDDAGPCTATTCDPMRGCASTPVPDGTPCPAPDPCLPIAVCAAGACTSTATGVAPTALAVRRYTLRSVRRHRAWRLRATVTSPGGGRSPLDPRDVTLELWGAGASYRYGVGVAADHFVSRPRRLVFVAGADRPVGGLRRLEIRERAGVRTIRFEAVVPAAALPAGPAGPITWLVRFGGECAREVAATCGAVGRGFACR